MSSASAKLTTPSAMRGFAVQHPRAAAVFGEIIGRWRGSRARRPGSPGYWAAYTQAEWCAWIGLKSSSTLKEHLDRLEAAGLIERERGHHMGNRVVSFIRPTPTGLSLAKPRPSDWQLLGIDTPTVDTVDSVEAVFAAAYEAKTVWFRCGSNQAAAAAAEVRLHQRPAGFGRC